MSDLSQLKKMLMKARTSPWSSWPYTDTQRSTLQNGITLTLGCPNGKGSYIQFMFAKSGKLIEAKMIDKRGYECRCKYCKVTNDKDNG